MTTLPLTSKSFALPPVPGHSFFVSSYRRRGGRGQELFMEWGVREVKTLFFFISEEEVGLYLFYL